MNKLWPSCVWTSIALLLASIGAFVYVEIANPHVFITDSSVYCPHVAIGKIANITMTKDYFGCVTFFNQSVPYLGSTIGFAGDKNVIEKGLTGPGFYFRAIDNTDKSSTWWTFMICIWYPIIFFAVLPVIYMVRKLRGHKSATHSEAAKA